MMLVTWQLELFQYLLCIVKTLISSKRESYSFKTQTQTHFTHWPTVWFTDKSLCSKRRSCCMLSGTQVTLEMHYTEAPHPLPIVFISTLDIRMHSHLCCRLRVILSLSIKTWVNSYIDLHSQAFVRTNTTQFESGQSIKWNSQKSRQTQVFGFH